LIQKKKLIFHSGSHVSRIFISIRFSGLRKKFKTVRVRGFVSGTRRRKGKTPLPFFRKNANLMRGRDSFPGKEKAKKGAPARRPREAKDKPFFCEKKTGHFE